VCVIVSRVVIRESGENRWRLDQRSLNNLTIKITIILSVITRRPFAREKRRGRIATRCERSPSRLPNPCICNYALTDNKLRPLIRRGFDAHLYEISGRRPGRPRAIPALEKRRYICRWRDEVPRNPEPPPGSAANAMRCRVEVLQVAKDDNVAGTAWAFASLNQATNAKPSSRRRKWTAPMLTAHR